MTSFARRPFKMEKITLRAILLFVMGVFLLLCGAFMDAMGMQINNYSSNRSYLPVNPLVIVGRLVLSLGIMMLVIAAVLLWRERRQKKTPRPFEEPTTTIRAPYDEPTNTSGRILESRPTSQISSWTQETRQTSTPISFQVTNYSSTLGSRNICYEECSPTSEGREVSSPAAALLLNHYSSIPDARNLKYPLQTRSLMRENHGDRYSSTYNDEIYSPFRPVSRGSTRTYSPEGNMASYATIHKEQEQADNSYNWRSHLTKEQKRSIPSSPDLDNPPPYEPPPYYP